MEKTEWEYFTRDGQEGLNEFLREINTRTPPEPNELIGLIQRGSKFHLWLKKTETKKNNKNQKWQWKSHIVSQVAFRKKVNDNNGKNIIPIGFNNNQNIWYLERVQE